MIYIALVLSVIGIWLVVHGIGCCRRHPVKGVVRCTCGLAPLLGGLLLAVLALNLHTYARLTGELPVADLRFKQIGAQTFDAEIIYPNGHREQHLLAGDDWRMEAQFLKWKGWATLLGMDPQYRLERLAGRYQDIERERTAPHSVVDLSRTQNLPAALDMWKFARQRPRLMPLIDATYGTATYLPMRDGAAYRVTVTNSGLIARELDGQ